MGDIKIKDIEKAKRAALEFLKNICAPKIEAEFFMLLVVFIQLINCVLYKQVGDTAKLNFKGLDKMCKDIRIKRLFTLRNIACHLYGTSYYRSALNDVLEVFKAPYYTSIHDFILEVVASIEDGTFIEKYGVVQKKDPTDEMLSYAQSKGKSLHDVVSEVCAEIPDTKGVGSLNNAKSHWEEYKQLKNITIE